MIHHAHKPKSWACSLTWLPLSCIHFKLTILLICDLFGHKKYISQEINYSCHNENCLQFFLIDSWLSTILNKMTVFHKKLVGHKFCDFVRILIDRILLYFYIILMKRFSDLYQFVGIMDCSWCGAACQMMRLISCWQSWMQQASDQIEAARGQTGRLHSE